jgi:hypothetical protein
MVHIVSESILRFGPLQSVISKWNDHDSLQEIAEARRYIAEAGYRCLSGSIPEKLHIVAQVTAPCAYRNSLSVAQLQKQWASPKHSQFRNENRKGCMMATVPPPRGKGAPPTASGVIGNLDKPESEPTLPLNFKVPKSFKVAFKTDAVEQGQPMSQLLQQALRH